MLENEQDSAGETVKIDRFADPQIFFGVEGWGPINNCLPGGAKPFFGKFTATLINLNFPRSRKQFQLYVWPMILIIQFVIQYITLYHNEHFFLNFVDRHHNEILEH